MNRKILQLFFLFFISSAIGQTITPQVINSAGGNWTLPNGITVSDNIGEPFVSTISNSNNMITQGFLQNFVVTNVFSVTVINNNVSCKDKNDGNISIAITTNASAYTTQYFWNPQSVCPTNNCSSIDSLKPGNYSVNVKITYTVNNQVKTDSSNTRSVIITDANGPCKVFIYNGVTPNGDGVNDVFTIDNISDFPNNHISIYSRWGQLIYETHGYDNVTKFWPRKDEAGNLNSTTYFYVLDLGDGTAPIKNWVEVLKN